MKTRFKAKEIHIEITNHYVNIYRNKRPFYTLKIDKKTNITIEDDREYGDSNY